MMPMSPNTIDSPRATRMRMQPFTRPMNSWVYQISSGKPKSVRSSDLLAEGLLRIEFLALAGPRGRLAADGMDNVEVVPPVLHPGGRLALAEVHVLDVHVVAGADLLGALQVLELPPFERARDLVGLERFHLARGVEEDPDRGIGRRRVTARRALPERVVAVVVLLGRRVLVFQGPVPRHARVGVLVDALARGLREGQL